ncbi:cytochrome-c peroxidase [Roseateles albus]|uniref:Cytochrome c peroxidase n=1 Tax=Roseateles albus TaxID=2987525 RepID=A0ABT5KHP9_9BURK|nr:cytochrome c peroxidase [Roseateles albus]MDC8773469.1 cytochrome c peroxidase [Roseateles albus]
MHFSFKSSHAVLPRLLVLAVAAMLQACGGGSGGEALPSVGSASTGGASAQASLGAKIFNDMSLSASGRQSCASCHAAETGHAGANSLAAQMGGAMLDLQGGRSSPSMRYLSSNKPFQIAADGTPSGGFFWDGRANSLQDQAAKPFLNPREMANLDAADLARRLAKASYADELRRMFGEDIFSRPDEALARVALLLQTFQMESAEFRPFSSKFDQVLRGQATLNEQELRGLALFNAKDKGNCAACHPSAKGRDGAFPMFTDFTYDNLGVPRNSALSQNNDPTFYDLGLCARDGGDLTAKPELCGKFKVPSLRNVALRKVFFHNGGFTSLKEVLNFYVTRDTNPERWYSRGADGTLNKFDDLPAAYKANVNISEGPYNRKPGEQPALSDAEIDDVLAFLGTLSDGYKK